MFEIINKSGKKRILKSLEQYGIEKIDYLLISTGKRLRAFSGIISKNELLVLLKNLNVDSVGLNFASLDDGIRLSLDAVHLLQNKINKKVVEIDDGQAEHWFRGMNLTLPEEIKDKGFIILKNKDDFIGVGKSTGKTILNYLPKERRIR